MVNDDVTFARVAGLVELVGLQELVQVFFFGVQILSALNVTTGELVGISAVYNHVVLDNVVVFAVQYISHLREQRGAHC